MNSSYAFSACFSFVWIILQPKQRFKKQYQNLNLI